MVGPTALSRARILLSKSSAPELALALACVPFGFEALLLPPFAPFVWTPVPLQFFPGRIPFRQFSGIAHAGSAGVRFGCTGEEWADDENGMTSADAQAFKRACSCFGLGRYFDHHRPMVAFGCWFWSR